MKKVTILASLMVMTLLCYSFRNQRRPAAYTDRYETLCTAFISKEEALLQLVKCTDLNDEAGRNSLRAGIQQARNEMKKLDFWFRYLEPTMYKRVNGPLPVEWETEVFEKFEKPYKRQGAGLTLAALYLGEEKVERDSLLQLLEAPIRAMNTYRADSITNQLDEYHHFFLCNRLHLLNLAAIYTTGFECPDTEQVIPELLLMMEATDENYHAFNESFAATPMPAEYLDLYKQAIAFVRNQPKDFTAFDHFSFIRDYVNPLYKQNQHFINQYHVISKNLIDYALNKNEAGIFDKGLYDGQNPKGIFKRVRDEQSLAEIDRIGKLLFYDPILSGNNERSCVSCHKPEQFFTDTTVATSLRFDHTASLTRNTPSLLNAQYNHLIMADGKHFTLQHQVRGVVTNKDEMGGEEEAILRKVLSCKEYKNAFTALLKYTPEEPEIAFEHIASALTFYYAKFSGYYAPFDEAVNENKYLDPVAKQGFNLFMSKAQCATCHFVPQFNGVKPPYIGSEFEVLGVPADTAFSRLSDDKGRYEVNPADETLRAFRTGTVRNAAHTMPYMHNGVFRDMDALIEFYNNGGGAGRGLKVDNQTLSSDSLKLTPVEKKQLAAFVGSLNEKIIFDKAPQQLPSSAIKAVNRRRVGGNY